MAPEEEEHDPRSQAEAAREAFEQEFERFARFRSGAGNGSLTLTGAEEMRRQLVDVRARHLGRKSSIAACKKLIGRCAPEERAAFGQLVQRLEGQMTAEIDETEKALSDFIEAARSRRESIDVTIPGRRRRSGHLHPIT